MRFDWKDVEQMNNKLLHEWCKPKGCKAFSQTKRCVCVCACMCVCQTSIITSGIGTTVALNTPTRPVCKSFDRYPAGRSVRRQRWCLRLQDLALFGIDAEAKYIGRCSKSPCASGVVLQSRLHFLHMRSLEGRSNGKWSEKKIKKRYCLH
mmetsp:Transcript_3728/g.5973  ORF Transcript_3728/g.5973 Transcript_3728/m.5973 type:complete len:150 (-) Transcript_3728:324-773(-)